MQDVYVYEFYKSLNCPRALTCWLLFSNREYEQLVNLEFDPDHYNDLDKARDSLAAVKFLSKSTFLPISIDKKEVALKKFYESESQCKATNSRLRKVTPFEGILSAAKHKILQILGDDFDREEFIDSCNWGPGATRSVKRRDANYPKKYLIESDITSEAYDFVKDWFHIAYPTWSRDRERKAFCIQNSSKIVTVPKNAKTDRVIAIEPGVNTWFQKGIGSMIRRKLKRAGIDLNNQSHNQEFARLGSKFNHLATVDFSSASDTISKAVVEILLPPRWYALMMAFRSSFGLVEGNTIEFEKFSSMGNGFTFELESLIFYAVAFATRECLGMKGSISVYGDDVVLPSSCVELYASVCAHLGFTVNKSKSYSSSYYRESCGEHFWNGRAIRPYFQKESPYESVSTLLKAANSVRRFAHRRNTYGCDRKLRRPWQILTASLGDNFPRISDGYGDSGVIENLDHPLVRTKKAPFQLEGWIVRVWTDCPVMCYISHGGLLSTRLKEIGSNTGMEHGNEIPSRVRSRKVRIALSIPRWFDLGPWL